jgi:ribosomal protein L7/L12
MPATFTYTGDAAQAAAIRDAVDAWLADPVGTLTLTRPDSGIDLEFVLAGAGRDGGRIELIGLLRHILGCGLADAKRLTDRGQFTLPAGAYLAYMDREQLTQAQLITRLESHGCHHVQ